MTILAVPVTYNHEIWLLCCSTQVHELVAVKEPGPGQKRIGPPRLITSNPARFHALNYVKHMTVGQYTPFSQGGHQGVRVFFSTSCESHPNMWPTQ